MQPRFPPHPHPLGNHARMQQTNRFPLPRNPSQSMRMRHQPNSNSTIITQSGLKRPFMQEPSIRFPSNPPSCYMMREAHSQRPFISNIHLMDNPHFLPPSFPSGTSEFHHSRFNRPLRPTFGMSSRNEDIRPHPARFRLNFPKSECQQNATHQYQQLPASESNISNPQCSKVKNPRLEKLIFSNESQVDISMKCDDANNEQLQSLGLPISFGTTKVVWGNNKAKKESKNFLQGQIFNELATSQFTIDAPKPIEAPDQSLFCQVCNLSCNSLETFNSHLIGKMHLKKVDKFNELNGMSAARKYYCEVCQQDYFYYNAFDEHIQGSKHGKKLHLLKIQKLKFMKHPSVYCRDCDLYLDPEVMLKHKSGRSHLIASGKLSYEPSMKKFKYEAGTDVTITTEDVAKNEKFEELMKLTDCDICRIKFKAEADAIEHYQSNYHVQKMKNYKLELDLSSDSESNS